MSLSYTAAAPTTHADTQMLNSLFLTALPTQSTPSPTPSTTSPSPSVSTAPVEGQQQPAVAPPKRRKFTPAQLSLLETTYHRTTHPTREERDAIAEQGGMDRKSILVWFQNKRSAERRLSARNAAAAATTATTTGTTDVTGHAAAPSGNPIKRPVTRALSLPESTTVRNSSSLMDEVVSMKERVQPIECSTNNNSKTFMTATNNHAQGNLWESMLSSPSDPHSSTLRHSSPDRHLEIKRRRKVHPNPNFPYARGSLEWACANARARRQVDEDEDTEVDYSGNEENKNSGSFIERFGSQGRKVPIKGLVSEVAPSPPPVAQQTPARDDEVLRAAWALCGLSGKCDELNKIPPVSSSKPLQRSETSHF